MPERNRQENRNEPGSDRSLKPLIEEYLASTREPVGSRNLFRETLDQAEQAEPPASAARREVAPAEPAAIILYLVCVAVLLIAALAVGFL